MNMKIKWCITGLMLMLFSFSLIAQRPNPGPLRQESRERIEAQRIAFITQKLSLTPDEAAKFWPIYNEHKDDIRELRDDMERPDLMNVTDNEASVIIERHFQMEEKRLELKRTLFSRLRTVIGPRKILMLHAAEKEFNRELLRRANEFRKQ